MKKVIQLITHRRILDSLGKDFRGSNLNRVDFSMSLLIGANLKGCLLKDACFLGTDIRDTNIKNTDLSHGHFLIQSQINSIIGNTHTVLPSYLTYPKTWID